MRQIRFPLVAMAAFLLTSCGETARSDPVYNAFAANAASASVDLSQYSGYSIKYVNERAQLFCHLMDSGDLVHVTTLVNFGDTPGGLLSKPDIGGALQKLILRAGTPILCPQNSKYLQ